MAQTIATRGSGSFPTPGNPQTFAGNAVLPSVSGTLAGTGIWPSNPNAFAGAIGNITLNGVVIPIDLTIMKAENVVAAITASAAPVTAAISQFSNRLILTSASGVAITIAGTTAVLTALGFTAGVYN